VGAAKKKKSIPEVKREKLRLDEIEFDPEAEALASSDQMRPYIQFMAARNWMKLVRPKRL